MSIDIDYIGQYAIFKMHFECSFPKSELTQTQGNSVQGWIQDFHLKGRGGAKDYMRERTLRARNPKSLSAGIQGPLRALEALGFF